MVQSRPNPTNLEQAFPTIHNHVFGISELYFHISTFYSSFRILTRNKSGGYCPIFFLFARLVLHRIEVIWPELLLQLLSNVRSFRAFNVLKLLIASVSFRTPLYILDAKLRKTENAILFFILVAYIWNDNVLNLRVSRGNLQNMENINKPLYNLYQ